MRYFLKVVNLPAVPLCALSSKKQKKRAQKIHPVVKLAIQTHKYALHVILTASIGQSAIRDHFRKNVTGCAFDL